LEDIYHCADRVVVMERGKVVANDSPRAVGALLHEQQSEMFAALPTPVRVFYGTDAQGDCPLTVREGQAASHKGFGWETLTDTIIRIANECERPLVFILWGGNARMKKSFITNPQHLVIQSPHPSPLSAFAGFFGSKPFSKTNEFLIKTGQSPIHWESVLKE